MYRHLLVPLDGSAYSEQALRPAIFLADALGSRLSLLAVTLQTSETPAAAGSVDEAATRTRAYLEDAAARLPPHSTPIDLRTRCGTQAAEEIIEFARRESVDLIVMSTHGSRGDGQAALGSTTWKVAQQASCPVLLNRGRFSTGG